MRYGAMGNSGLVVSEVGLGCNAFGARIDQQQTDAVVAAALDHGVTLFDTADVYGEGRSEEMLGKALGSNRDAVIVATKFGLSDRDGEHFGAYGSRRYIRRAVEASLRRLGTDYIDLYQIHRPDPITPVAETLSALTELVREGKVRYIGSSNFSSWQVVEADWVAHQNHSERFISAQNEYSLYNRSAEAELVPACLDKGIGILPYFPLAYGLLTGKYRRGEPAPAGSRLANPKQAKRLENANWEIIEGLSVFAMEVGVTPLELAIGGLAAQPAVASVICGATTAEQVASNVTAGQWRPTEEELAKLVQVWPAQGFTYTTFA